MEKWFWKKVIFGNNASGYFEECFVATSFAAVGFAATGFAATGFAATGFAATGFVASSICMPPTACHKAATNIKVCIGWMWFQLDAKNGMKSFSK